MLTTYSSRLKAAGALRRPLLRPMVIAGLALSFVYGVGVGRYSWPPAGLLHAAVQSAKAAGALSALGRSKAEPNNPTYHKAKLDLFRRTSGTADVVMLGDSIIDWGTWHELLPDWQVINRGIPGDTTSGVLARLDEVLGRKPRRVFVMIGTNDISAGLTNDKISANIESILSQIQNGGSAPVLQSILYRGRAHDDLNARIAALNSDLAAFCAKRGIAYLDVNRVLAPAGYMPDALTHDGLHLAGEAYLVWRDLILREAS